MSPRFDPAKDLVDLRHKVIIVTGANRQSGLGYGLVRHLARAGAKVYIAARNEKQSLESIKKLREDGLGLGNGEVCFLKVDMSDPRVAKKAAEEFLSKENRLDVLVNNAALVFASFGINSDGISNVVATNLIGPFVFTQTLLPLMISTAQEADSDVRIVNLSSLAHMLPPKIQLETVDDLNKEFKGRPLAKFTRYGHTKLLIILWTKALQKRLDASDPATKITVMAVNPGNVDTFSNRWPLPWLWKPIVRIAMTASDPEHGSYSMAFASAGRAVKENRDKYAGKYLDENSKVAKPSADARSDKLADDLWILAEKVITDLSV